MEQYFNTFFEDVGHERSLILLLGLIEPSTLKQPNFTDHEIDIIEDIPLRKLPRQRNLKEMAALDLIEKHFSD